MIKNDRIRVAHPGDAGTIAGIHVDTWRATYAKILPAAYLRHLRYDDVAKGIFKGLLDPDTTYLVADDQRENAVGYICGGPDRSGHPFYQGEIYEFYIAAPHQRKGLGRRLLSALALHLYQRRIYTLVAWVLAQNPNRRFYEHAGGLLAGTKTIAFANKKLQAVAYGWIDMTLIWI